MPRTGDYSLGKIYKLISDETDDIYIGSTCQKLLSKRLVGHKSDYNKFLNGKSHYITSFDIIKYNDCKIILIENYPCKDIHELLARERHYIQNNLCVNKCMPTRTMKEWYEDNKEEQSKKKSIYYEQNKDVILGKNKQYYEENKDALIQYQKQYRETNKDILSDKKKQYFEVNKTILTQRNKDWRERNVEYIRHKKSITVKCECGSIIVKCALQRHMRSNKHKQLLEQKAISEPDPEINYD